MGLGGDVGGRINFGCREEQAFGVIFAEGFYEGWGKVDAAEKGSALGGGVGREFGQASSVSHYALSWEVSMGVWWLFDMLSQVTCSL